MKTVKTPAMQPLRSMHGLLAGAGLKSPPVAKAPKPAAVAAAKPKTPKLASVQVTHNYAGGAKSKQFTFKKPTDLSAHIKKVQSSEWLHPNVQRSAAKVDRLMDIG
jgi:hypothetical protein